MSSGLKGTWKDTSWQVVMSQARVYGATGKATEELRTEL